MMDYLVVMGKILFEERLLIMGNVSDMYIVNISYF